MGVISVKEKWDGREGSEKEKGQREYTRTFVVQVDSTDDGPVTVLSAAALPKVGNFYQSGNDIDTTAVCTNRTARQKGNAPSVWEVTCTYSTQVDQEQQEENPLDRPPVFNGGLAQFTRPVERDLNSVEVKNSAGQRYDPPVEIDDSRPRFSITRNEINAPLQFMLDYHDAVNSDWFLGFEPGTIKLAGISFTQQIEKQLKYFQVTYEFDFRRKTDDEPNPWRKWIRDMGRMQIDPNDASKLIPCKDKNGRPVIDPVDLDGEGTQLDANAGSAFYFEYTVYPEKPFSVLGFT